MQFENENFENLQSLKLYFNNLTNLNSLYLLVLKIKMLISKLIVLIIFET